MKRSLASTMLAAAVATVLWSASSSAVLLDFNSLTSPSGDQPMNTNNASYGSIPGQVDISYSSSGGDPIYMQSAGNTGSKFLTGTGDVSGNYSVYPYPGVGIITFTPAAGNKVQIGSLVLGKWWPPQYEMLTDLLTVSDGVQADFTQTVTLTTGAPNQVIAPNFTGGVGLPVTLTLTKQSEHDMAIDDINFQVIIPEPASLSLLALSGLVLLKRQRKS